MKASLCSLADGLKPCWTYYRAGRWGGGGEGGGGREGNNMAF